MAMNFLKDFKKTIDKMEGVTQDGGPPRYWFSSGNYTLNRIVSGSFYKAIPQGRVTALCGPSGAGKSFLLGNILKQAQDEGAHLLVIDSENALDDDWMAAIGVKVGEDDGYNYVGVNTIPQCVKVISSFIKGYKSDYGENNPDAPKVLIAIDSVDMLMTESEAEKYDKGETVGDQGQHPKQIKAMLRTVGSSIKSTNISLIVTKQVYNGGKEHAQMTGEGVWVINGSIRYSCSQIILITKLKLKDEATKEALGIRMKCESFKTRFTKPFQTVTIMVPYDTGMDKWSGLFEVALQMGVVVKPSMGWYSIAGEDKKWREREFPTYAERVLELCEQRGDALIANTDGYEEDTGDEGSARSRKNEMFADMLRRRGDTGAGDD
jgi:RecA/RadA recombinase